MKNYEDQGYNQYSFGNIHSPAGFMVPRHAPIDVHSLYVEEADKDKTQSMVEIRLYGYVGSHGMPYIVVYAKTVCSSYRSGTTYLFQ